jgi:hypothetical protein
MSSDSEEVDRHVALTKELFDLAIGKHSVTLYKPRTSTGNVHTFSVPRLYKLLAECQPTLYSHIVSIKSWLMSYCIYLKDTASVNAWMDTKYIIINDYDCKIFVPNNFDEVHT